MLCRLQRHGNLPRTNKVSTGHFVTRPPVGPSFRFPYSRNKIKKDIRLDVLSILSCCYQYTLMRPPAARESPVWKQTSTRFHSYMMQFRPQALRAASETAWNLPRTNKVSTGHFVTLPPVGPSFRFPYSRNKIKKDIRLDVLFYW